MIWFSFFDGWNRQSYVEAVSFCAKRHMKRLGHLGVPWDSLKLTASLHLKMDGTGRRYLFPFWGREAYFQGRSVELHRVFVCFFFDFVFSSLGGSLLCGEMGV